MKTAIACIAVTGLLAAGYGGFAYAQGQDHSQHQASASAPPQEHDHAHHISQAANDEDTAIFCPTMKTGQLCSHGTANVLHLKGEKQQAWIAMAQKYNKAVDVATLQLFKDAEGSLTPEQVQLLKAWFAVGLNPEINDLLYGKGLGPKKP